MDETAITGRDGRTDVMWVHLIRILSIVMVLWVHSTAEIFFYGAHFGSGEWWIADIYDSMARTCVPLLFMISGYLLLGKSEPPAAFLKKRVAKVMIPLAAWSVVFFLWVYFWEYAHPSKASSMLPERMWPIHDAPLYAAFKTLWAPVYYHLWFLYALLGLYLFTPFLRALVRRTGQRQLWWIIGLLYAGTLLLRQWEYLNGSFNIISMLLLSGGIPYYLLGDRLGRIGLSRRLFWTMLLVAALATAFTIIGVYYQTAGNNGKLKEDLWGASSPNIVLMSAALFVVLRYAAERCPSLHQGTLASVLRRLSAASFGVYLVHVLFLYALGEGAFGFTLTAVSGNPLLFTPILVTVIFALSFALVSLLQKAPLLRHLVP